MLTLVSAFFRLRDRSVDEDEQFRRFDQLAACGLPILLFLDRQLAERMPKHPNVRVELSDLESLWPFQRAELPLPDARTPDKDTRDFLLLQNAKLDLLAAARKLDDSSSHFAWADFGLMKVVKRPDDFLNRLRGLKPPPSCVLAPGCWSKEEAAKANGGVCWRFCGGFLLTDRDSIPALVERYHTAFGRLRQLTWEVNVWAEMERRGQRFDWYKADHDDSIIGGTVSAASGKKRICLTMIVKNEVKIIERCLDAARPYIDTWAITDTGSTDGTAQLIAAYFMAHKIPGRIFQGEFKNFAQARNLSLDNAKTVPNWEYALLIDADMVVQGTLQRELLVAPSYKLVQKSSSLDYWNTRLVRRDADARYIGVTHEFLSVPSGEAGLAGFAIDDRNDGGSKSDKAERDIRLLNEGLAEEPKNGRYMFYLANTYRETGRHHEAIQWYKRRIPLGDWDEEIWASYYNIAKSYEAIGDEPNFVKACLDAYNYRPVRGEPLKLLSKHYRLKGQNEIAVLIAEMLTTVEYPKDILFVEREVYDFGARQELAIAGYYSKIPRRREIAYRACATLTVHPHQFAREEARRNFTHYARSAKDSFGAEVRPIEWKPDDGYAPMNPSICVMGDRRLVLVRTVNYTVTEQGQYPTTDGSSIIKTRNYILEMDADWKPLRAQRIEDATGIKRTDFPVEGFEDCRLWPAADGSFRASATVRDIDPGGECETAVLTLDEQWRVTAVSINRDYEANRAQKNWMPILGEPGRFLYFCEPTIVVEHVDGKTTERSRHVPRGIFFGNFRGGSQLVPHGDGWICLVHEVVWRPERVYLHRFVKFNSAFAITAVSDPFYFSRVSIEFCAGLARDGGKLVATFGVYDASAHLAFFDPEQVDRALRVVGTAR